MTKNFLTLLTVVLLSAGGVFAQTDIRSVDFSNFTYEPDYCGGEDRKTITVRDGQYTEEKMVEGYPDRLHYAVREPVYGDLDGDRIEEAVVISICNTGGTGNFSELYIYKTQKDGPPRRVMLLSGGDRAYGGMRAARIDKGLLVVESYDAGEEGGACCPEYVVTSNYRLDRRKLKEIGKPSRAELYPATRLSFDRGEYDKTFTVSIPPETEIRRYVVGAAEGQILKVTMNTSDAKVTLYKGEAEVQEEDERLVAVIGKTGDHIVEFRNYSDKPVEFEANVSIRYPFDPDPDPEPVPVESIYTDLAPDKCRTIELEEEGAGYYRGECEGVGDYKLEVVEGDLRQSINVVHTGSGGKWELELWRNVSPAFSYLGEKAEWRVRRVDGKTVPVALIVRYNASENPDDPDKVTSYLVVTKFEGEFVCVTDVVKPIAKQNEKARQLADDAAGKPCLVRD